MSYARVPSGDSFASLFSNPTSLKTQSIKQLRTTGCRIGLVNAEVSEEMSIAIRQTPHLAMADSKISYFFADTRGDEPVGLIQEWLGHEVREDESIEPTSPHLE